MLQSKQEPEFVEGDIFRIIVPLDDEYSFDFDTIPGKKVPIIYQRVPINADNLSKSADKVPINADNLSKSADKVSKNADNLSAL